MCKLAVVLHATEAVATKNPEKFQACAGSMTSVMLVQRSTNWANKPPAGELAFFFASSNTNVGLKSLQAYKLYKVD